MHHFKKMCLSGYGPQAKSTILETALYYKDQPTTATQNKTEDEAASNIKSGYLLRNNHVKSSQVVPFCTSLHIDFLTCPRWLPPGVRMLLKFIRNDDSFVIIARTGKYKIKLLELFVEFRKIKLSKQITEKTIKSFVEDGRPYIMPFLQGKYVTHTIAAHRSSFILSDICQGSLPKQLLVSFVRHDSFNSLQKNNGFIFENLKIKSLAFKVNGENVPPQEYRPDFNTTPPDCLREYQHFMNAIGVKRLNTGVAITIEDFVNTCTFFVLDLTPEQCNNHHTHGK